MSVVANPDNNSALAQASSLTQNIVDWSEALNQSALNVIGILNAWNSARNNPPATVPSTINNTANEDQKFDLERAALFLGGGLIALAAGIFLYKKIR